jgi:hypothetical protein
MNDITADELNQAQWHQQVDYDERRQQVMDSWQRIKRGEYTDVDLATVEAALRQLL